MTTKITSKIDVAPAYPGCDQNKGKEVVKDFTSKKISKFLGSNFNTDLAEDLGLKGQNRIYVQFKISEAGEIQDIKA